MDMTYTASARQTFDTVSLNVYGDEKYAYLLLSANPLLCHKMTFDGGEKLRVPELPADAQQSLPPWKRGA